jgi:hypothetical protein
LNRLLKVLLLLLLASPLFAAQSITIPEGTSSYGPVSVTTLHRFAGLYIDRTSSSFTKATISLFHSTDDGKTFASQPFCKFTHLGGGTATQTFGADCPKPEGTTHITATALVEGGSITIAKTPNLRSR